MDAKVREALGMLRSLERAFKTLGPAAISEQFHWRKYQRTLDTLTAAVENAEQERDEARARVAELTDRNMRLRGEWSAALAREAALRGFVDACMKRGWLISSEAFMVAGNLMHQTPPTAAPDCAGGGG